MRRESHGYSSRYASASIDDLSVFFGADFLSRFLEQGSFPIKVDGASLEFGPWATTGRNVGATRVCTQDQIIRQLRLSVLTQMFQLLTSLVDENGDETSFSSNQSIADCIQEYGITINIARDINSNYVVTLDVTLNEDHYKSKSMFDPNAEIVETVHTAERLIAVSPSPLTIPGWQQARTVAFEQQQCVTYTISPENMAAQTQAAATMENEGSAVLPIAHDFERGNFIFDVPEGGFIHADPYISSIEGEQQKKKAKNSLSSKVSRQLTALAKCAGIQDPARLNKFNALMLSFHKQGYVELSGVVGKLRSSSQATEVGVLQDKASLGRIRYDAQTESFEFIWYARVCMDSDLPLAMICVVDKIKADSVKADSSALSITRNMHFVCTMTDDELRKFNLPQALALQSTDESQTTSVITAGQWQRVEELSDALSPTETHYCLMHGLSAPDDSWHCGLSDGLIQAVKEAGARYAYSRAGVALDQTSLHRIDFCIQAVVDAHPAVIDRESRNQFVRYLCRKMMEDDSSSADNAVDAFDEVKDAECQFFDVDYLPECNLAAMRDMLIGAEEFELDYAEKIANLTRYGFGGLLNATVAMKGAYPALDILRDHILAYVKHYADRSPEQRLQSLQVIKNITGKTLRVNCAPRSMRLPGGVLSRMHKILANKLNGVTIPDTVLSNVAIEVDSAGPSAPTYSQRVWREIARRPRVEPQGSFNDASKLVTRLTEGMRLLDNMNVTPVFADCINARLNITLALDSVTATLERSSLQNAHEGLYTWFRDNFQARTAQAHSVKEYDIKHYHALLLVKVVHLFKQRPADKRSLSDYRAFAIAVDNIKRMTTSEQLKNVIDERILVGEVRHLLTAHIPLARAKGGFAEAVRVAEAELFEARMELRKRDTSWRGWFRRYFTFAPKLGSSVLRILPKTLWESKSAAREAVAINRELDLCLPAELALAAFDFSCVNDCLDHVEEHVGGFKEKFNGYREIFRPGSKHDGHIYAGSGEGYISAWSRYSKSVQERHPGLRLEFFERWLRVAKDAAVERTMSRVSAGASVPAIKDSPSSVPSGGAAPDNNEISVLDLVDQMIANASQRSNSGCEDVGVPDGLPNAGSPKHETVTASKKSDSAKTQYANLWSGPLSEKPEDDELGGIDDSSYSSGSDAGSDSAERALDEFPSSDAAENLPGRIVTGCGHSDGAKPSAQDNQYSFGLK